MTYSLFTLINDIFYVFTDWPVKLVMGLANTNGQLGLCGCNISKKKIVGIVKWLPYKSSFVLFFSE